MSPAPRYRGYRFPPEIISHAVWLSHRFGLSFRDVEDLLAERGVTLSSEAIRTVVQGLRARRCAHAQTPTWPDG